MTLYLDDIHGRIQLVPEGGHLPVDRHGTRRDKFLARPARPEAGSGERPLESFRGQTGSTPASACPASSSSAYPASSSISPASSASARSMAAAIAAAGASARASAAS